MIRPFQPSDKSALLNLLELNIPDFFHPEELHDFSHYLDHEVEDYFVVEASSQLLAAGGINYGFNQGKTARISWDMVHPAHQGKGLGTTLLQYRLEKIKLLNTIDRIEVRTTQLVYQFYQKLGFVLIQTEKDFWAPGFDLYQMEKRI